MLKEIEIRSEIENKKFSGAAVEAADHQRDSFHSVRGQSAGPGAEAAFLYCSRREAISILQCLDGSGHQKTREHLNGRQFTAH